MNRGLLEDTRVAGDYMGLKGNTGVYRGLQGYRRVNRGLEGDTRVNRGLQGNKRVAGDNMGLKGNTGVYRGITRVYSGIHGNTRVTHGYNCQYYEIVGRLYGWETIWPRFLENTDLQFFAI